MLRSVDQGSDGAGLGNAQAASQRSHSGGRGRLRYRVFFVLPDQVEGRCELGQDLPISADDVDAIERALIDRLGCTNALVIGWQELAARGARLPAAGKRI